MNPRWSFHSARIWVDLPTSRAQSFSRARAEGFSNYRNRKSEAKVAWNSSDCFESFSPLATRSNRMKFRLKRRTLRKPRIWYPASRGPSIFLDKYLGRSKGLCSQGKDVGEVGFKAITLRWGIFLEQQICGNCKHPFSKESFFPRASLRSLPLFRSS